MRIISGKLGGRKLFSIRGCRTRPTSDRVREALFNILAFRVKGTMVLDLFAGTGALGIEAASRGAAAVVCVDDNPAAIQTIQKNIQNLALEDRFTMIKWDIARNLNCLRKPDPVYDLVFLDPPYNRGLVAKTIKNLHQSKILMPEATLVAEHSVREKIPENRPFLELTDQRKYGKTLVSFLTYVL